MYVQYGCGWCAPAQWVNFDASPTLRFERLPVLGRLYSRNERRFPPGVRHADVARGLPVASGTCDGVYCSHVLEHLSLEDFDRALAETLRILKPGGIFRLVVPDLETAARDYLADLERGCARANTRFLQATHLGAERRPAGLGAFLRDWLGNSRHLWMWDHPSLATKLEEHGFAGVRRARFGDCEDAAFRAVEERGRFEKACALQAVRPR